MFNRIFKNRVDPPFSILIFLSFLIHATVLGIVTFIPSRGDTLNVSREYVVQQVNLVSPEQLQDETQNKKPLRRRSRAAHVKQIYMQEALVVAPPQALDPMTRWIVELTNSNGEEPDEANFVAETPSRVEEEMRAERTGQTPRRKRGTQKKRGDPNEPQMTARARPRKMRVNENPVRIASAQPAPQAAPRKEAPSAENGQAPPAQTPAANGGNAPTPSGENEGTMRKSVPGKSNLYPTLGELARKTPGDGGSAPQHVDGNEGEGEGEGAIELPGAPQAPDNFLPMVKKRGPITLLNAKSYTFAAFVRRVAYRIFDRFVLGFEPRHYGGSDWDAMRRGATYEAVMNRAGKAVNIIQHRSSGSDEFNALVRNAVDKGAWDTNVPDGAECADGFVHFMFIPKIIPSQETAAPDGSRGYSNFYMMAVAGIKECE